MLPSSLEELYCLIQNEVGLRNMCMFIPMSNPMAFIGISRVLLQPSRALVPSTTGAGRCLLLLLLYVRKQNQDG